MRWTVPVFEKSVDSGPLLYLSYVQTYLGAKQDEIVADFVALHNAINEVLLIAAQVLCPWPVQIPFESVLFCDLWLSWGGFARGMFRELKGRVVPWGKCLFYLCGACLFSERGVGPDMAGVPSKERFPCTRPCR